MHLTPTTTTVLHPSAASSMHHVLYENYECADAELDSILVLPSRFRWWKSLIIPSFSEGSISESRVSEILELRKTEFSVPET